MTTQKGSEIFDLSILNFMFENCSAQFYNCLLIHWPYFNYTDPSKHDYVNCDNISLDFKSGTNLTELFKVGDMEIECLVDTGASLVFVQSSVADKLYAADIGVEAETLCKPLKIVMGTSSVSYCLYVLNFQLVHNNTVFPIQAYVTDNLPYQIILGLSFLEKYGAVINVAKKTMQLEESVENLSIEHTPMDSYIYLNENVNIPPKCEVLVEVTLNNIAKENLLVMNYDTLSG
jgi:predicted aspartyl protease